MGGVGIVRTLVAWCPDWPVVAAGFGGEEPVAVVAAGRVVACSAVARDRGVTLGMRRRAAEGRCGDLVVLQRDDAREARAFDPVVAAVARLAPQVEVTRPGLCALATRGPARYHGGEPPLCRAIVEAARGAVSGACDVAEPVVRVGVADGPFAAALAARREVVVPPSGTAEFLAGFPVGVLGRPELADLLVRLGIGTLGAFAALDPATVAARFGPDGALAQRLARGLDDRSLRSRAPPAELVAAVELDPPAERVDIAAFAGRALAEDLMAQLGARGLTCTLLTIEAETEHGECLTRRWRAEDTLGPEAMGERLRWQLEGWLAGTVWVARTEDLPVGMLVRRACHRDPGDAVIAGYEVPFPYAAAKAGARAFPAILPTSPDHPGAPDGQRVLEALRADARPKLMLWADSDPVLPLATGRAFAAALGGELAHVIADAGHFLQEDAGAEIGGLIADWLRSTA